jgi:hypothetical protein
VSGWHSFSEAINLHVEGRIAGDDALRQERSAREILRRLADRPGVVLADEVGMGKTFVALAVATSVALSDEKRRPVVVMIPPSLREKWPNDFDVFREKCLRADVAKGVRARFAENAVEFLGLLDDSAERQSSIIFLPHGAMHRGLTDGWVKLAIIQRALYRRHHTQDLYRALSRCAGPLLWLGWAEARFPNIWDRLLETSPENWLRVLHRNGIGPHGDIDLVSDDHPVPRAVIEVLQGIDASSVYEALQALPQRQSSTWNDRVADTRKALTDLLKVVWGECLERLNFKLPLLVMDEAHHLKNAETQLAGLFQVPEAREDADAISRGALGGVFERMLFLTATPFQLGHHELCSVLERFDGIAWDSGEAPRGGRGAFSQEVAQLRERLDAAQLSALIFDSAWGSLKNDDLVANGKRFDDVQEWWTAVMHQNPRAAAVDRVLGSYERTFEKMRAAEELLKPWVIRHLKPRTFNGIARRERLAGAAIVTESQLNGDAGLEVAGPALLPFLLAARATVCSPDSRPVFAEGLASSYEAFLHTRKAAAEATDTDDERPDNQEEAEDIGTWYLEQLERALPLRGHQTSASHPKVAATARRAIEAWLKGEKVVVFCHYIATGHVLRQVISSHMQDEIARIGAEKIGCSKRDVPARLEKLGNRFFDTDSPARLACDAEVEALLREYQTLWTQRETLLEVTRRYLRTPSFLVRYFPLTEDRLDEAAVKEAFSAGDASGLTLRGVLKEFFDFLETRCVEAERNRYLHAIQSIQTGSITGREALATFSEDERQPGWADGLLPNVRLVNGSTKQETRQRLMLTFNSPFFPEILVASSVMAEGVDLHRFCRYVIHHDLCWNPSTLEQRTGRIDRIGAKAELCGQSIRVYLPYLAETQDEKMFRVVMDRERWFSVVMGEKFKVDARTTDKLAQRVPLPAKLAQDLAFRLEA